VADAHLDHHFFQITTPRLGARPSLGSLATSIPPRLEAQSTRRPEGDVARRPAMIGRGREGRMVRREGIEPST
jgi:hypothetical protein